MNNSSSIICAVLLALAPAASSKVLEDTVAVVNGTPVLLSDFQ